MAVPFAELTPIRIDVVPVANPPQLAPLNTPSDAVSAQPPSASAAAITTSGGGSVRATTANGRATGGAAVIDINAIDGTRASASLKHVMTPRDLRPPPAPEPPAIDDAGDGSLPMLSWRDAARVRTTHIPAARVAELQESTARTATTLSSHDYTHVRALSGRRALTGRFAIERADSESENAWVGDPPYRRSCASECAECWFASLTGFGVCVLLIGWIASFVHLSYYVRDTETRDRCPSLDRIGFPFFVNTILILSVLGGLLAYCLCVGCCWAFARECGQQIWGCINSQLLDAIHVIYGLLGFFSFIAECCVAVWVAVQLIQADKTAEPDCFTNANRLWTATIVTASFYSAIIGLLFFVLLGVAVFCAYEQCCDAHGRAQRRTYAFDDRLNSAAQAQVQTILFVGAAGGVSGRALPAFMHTLMLAHAKPAKPVAAVAAVADGGAAGGAVGSAKLTVVSSSIRPPARANASHKPTFFQFSKLVLSPRAQPDSDRAPYDAPAPEFAEDGYGNRNYFESAYPIECVPQKHPHFLPIPNPESKAASVVPAAAAVRVVAIDMTAPVATSGGSTFGGRTPIRFERAGLDVMQLIFSCSPARDAYRTLTRVCREWRRVIESDAMWIAYWSHLTACSALTRPKSITLAHIKCTVRRFTVQPHTFHCHALLPREPAAGAAAAVPLRQANDRFAQRLFRFWLEGWDLDDKSARRQFRTHAAMCGVQLIPFRLTALFDESGGSGGASGASGASNSAWRRVLMELLVPACAQQRKDMSGKPDSEMAANARWSLRHPKPAHSVVVWLTHRSEFLRMFQLNPTRCRERLRALFPAASGLSLYEYYNSTDTEWRSDARRFVEQYHIPNGAAGAAAAAANAYDPDGVAVAFDEKADVKQQPIASADESGDDQFWRRVVSAEPNSFDFGVERTIRNGEWSEPDRALNAIRWSLLSSAGYGGQNRVWISNGSLCDEPSQPPLPPYQPFTLEQSAPQPGAGGTWKRTLQPLAVADWGNGGERFERLKRAIDPLIPARTVGAYHTLSERFDQLLSLSLTFAQT